MMPATDKMLKKIQKVRVTYLGWFNMELPNEAFFPLNSRCKNFFNITVKISFTRFHSTSCLGDIFLHQKPCNLLVQTITEKMGSNRKRLLQKICHKVLSCPNC